MARDSNRFGALVLAAAALAASAPAAAQFGGLGNIGGLIEKAKTAKKIGDSLRKIGEPEEIKMGSDLAAMMLGAAPLIEDKADQHYINRLGRWLALHSERPDLPWKFGIVESDDVNAFSMPGGYVLMTRGMYERMRTESELAGVLAHEIAHVVAKHHLGALQSSLRNQALGDMAEYTNVGGGGLTGTFARALLAAGKEMYIKGLSKDDEYEADQMGAVIAARSGYSPYGIAGVLQTLSAAPDEKGFALMNKTHPQPVERIQRLDSAMGNRLDRLEGLVEDLPSFAALRNPAEPEPLAKPAATAKPTAKPTPRRN